MRDGIAIMGRVGLELYWGKEWEVWTVGGWVKRSGSLIWREDNFGNRIRRIVER